MAPSPVQQLISRELPDIENLLSLNPRVQTKGSLVPSAVTKAQKKHWKRNVDKSCVVRVRTICTTCKAQRFVIRIYYVMSVMSLIQRFISDNALLVQMRSNRASRIFALEISFQEHLLCVCDT